MTNKDRVHAVTVAGYPGDLAALATEVGRLRYDALAVFLDELSKELARQADGDRQRNRVVLAGRLEELAAQVEQNSVATHEIWRLCRKHVPHELKQTPEVKVSRAADAS